MSICAHVFRGCTLCSLAILLLLRTDIVLEEDDELLEDEEGVLLPSLDPYARCVARVVSDLCEVVALLWRVLPFRSGPGYHAFHPFFTHFRENLTFLGGATF